MNKTHLRWQFLILIIALLLAGCVPAGEQPGNQNALETIVAATLTAVSGGEPADAPAPAETSEPTMPEETSPTMASAFTPPRALQVAYIKDGNVYIWTEGESSVGLTSTHDAIKVRISDDGQFIAYERRDPNNFTATSELWVVNTSGPVNARLLVSQSELDALKASSPFSGATGMGIDLLEWRPKTHQLFYSTVPRFEGPGYAPGEDMRMVDVDTAEKKTIFNYNQGGMFYFSPDGVQVALANPDYISLSNWDGSNFRPNVLTFPLVGTYSEYQYHPAPIWAADSGSLRVAIPPEDTLAQPTPPTELWQIPADGSPATLLGSIPAVPFAWPDTAFSPNLDRVAYIKSVGEPTENRRELHIANPDSSGDYVFTTGVTTDFLGWTPDGTRFVYSQQDGSYQSMYLGTLATNGVFTIATDSSTVQQMRWVDNSRFLFFHQNGDVRELRISDVDGTNHAFIDTISGTVASYDFTQ